MDIVGILLTLLMIALVGFIVYLITKHIPMPEIFSQIITVGCAVLIIIYLIMIIAGRAPLMTIPLK